MGTNLRILITTGDSDGIGWEVTAKAVSTIGRKSMVQFVYFRSAKHPVPQSLDRLLKKKFKIQKCESLHDAHHAKFDPSLLLEISSSASPAKWVEEAASACLSGQFQALVTAPLSKISIADSGLKDIGHTEILARVTGAKDLLMGFIGKKFCVVLATGHRPLAQAIAELNPVRLRLAIAQAVQLRAILPAAKSNLPVALVGLNPHAGEAGLIGKEEIWFTGLLKDISRSVPVIGPLVPDSAFLPMNWPRYSVYICPYHDQGLIPFKMIHGFDGGVHLTLGLPFVRTSVDHGTAKDIYGKNKAQAGSMKDAILVAVRMSKERKQ